MRRTSPSYRLSRAAPSSRSFEARSPSPLEHGGDLVRIDLHALAGRLRDRVAAGVHALADVDPVEIEVAVTINDVLPPLSA